MSLLFALAVQAATQQSSAKIKINQSRLDAMSDACKAPRKWLKHRGGDQIDFSPSPDAKYTMVECVLRRLRGSMLPMKLGFIGNEQLSEDK